MGTICCNTSVGVIIDDPSDRVLLIERADGKGWAPPAGHALDEHAGWRDAAIAEVREETGLAVTTLTDTGVGGWRPNRCGRDDPARLGHEWRIYRASAAGDLSPDERETLGARWADRSGLQDLVDQTVRLARRRSGSGVSRPGMEAVWVQWLCDLGLVTVPTQDLALVDAMTRPSPHRTWVIDWRPDDGPERLWVDLTADERTGLSGLLAETTGDRGHGMITLSVGTSPAGPRRTVVLAMGRIVSLRPYDDEVDLREA